MMITRFDPFKEFANLQERMEYFNRVLNGNSESEARSKIDFIPTVNTREADDAYYIEIDLPGVKKENVSIDVNDNIITISGERKVDDERKNNEFYRVESIYGKFERSFTLPDDVDTDKIEAKMENGVLIVKIPKMQVVDKAPKKIEIK